MIPPKKIKSDIAEIILFIVIFFFVLRKKCPKEAKNANSRQTFETKYIRIGFFNPKKYWLKKFCLIQKWHQIVTYHTIHHHTQSGRAQTVAGRAVRQAPRADDAVARGAEAGGNRRLCDGRAKHAVDPGKGGQSDARHRRKQRQQRRCRRRRWRLWRLVGRRSVWLGLR